MVCAADQLAASAGIEMLAGGGSAADAVVATGAAHGRRRPAPVRLGGDVLAMVAPPGSAPRALLSVGRAGAGSDPARMRAAGPCATMPLRGDVRSVPVPGAVDGWLSLHGRYGRLPLDDGARPAIELAEDGFAASIMLALASPPRHTLSGAGELCPDGPLEVGQRVRLPGHRPHPARASPPDGRDAFYGGEFGRGLIDARTGPTTRPGTSAPTWRAGASRCRVRVWDHDLWTVPPPSQGYLTLAGVSGRRRGRPGQPTPTTRSGRTCSSSRGVPSATTAPTSSSTAPTAPRCCTPTASLRRRRG